MNVIFFLQDVSHVQYDWVHLNVANSTSSYSYGHRNPNYTGLHSSFLYAISSTEIVSSNGPIELKIHVCVSWGPSLSVRWFSCWLPISIREPVWAGLGGSLANGSPVQVWPAELIWWTPSKPFWLSALFIPYYNIPRHTFHSSLHYTHYRIYRLHLTFSYCLFFKIIINRLL